MAEINLTQAEADTLLAMEKRPEDDKAVTLPAGGQKFAVQLTSRDGREKFLLDLSRGTLISRKSSFRIVPEV